MSEPVRSIDTGNWITPIVSTVSSGKEIGHTDQVLRLMRKPAPIPRKEPSSTKLEK